MAETEDNFHDHVSFVFNHLQLRIVVTLKTNLSESAGSHPQSLPCFFNSPEWTNMDSREGLK